LARTFVEGGGLSVGALQDCFFDQQRRGLMLDVRSTGRKTFYQRYTDERGRERQFRSARPCRRRPETIVPATTAAS
jgi:hypothetical protein